jgi:hypothetical protein
VKDTRASYRPCVSGTVTKMLDRTLGVPSIVQQQCGRSSLSDPTGDRGLRCNSAHRPVVCFNGLVWPWRPVTVMTVLSATIFI